MFCSPECRFASLKENSWKAANERTKKEIGRRFGRLVVSDIVPGPGGRVRVSCDCGVTKEVSIHNLRHKLTVSCGCQIKETRWIRPKEIYPKWAIPGPVWKKIKDCAQYRNIEFEISKEEAYALLLDQDRCCALSGVEITLPSAPSDFNEFTASLDRIDTSLGYKLGNVQWVHKTVNLMKNAIPTDVFISMCHMIANNTVLPSDGRNLCRKYINVWQRNSQRKLSVCSPLKNP
jgi:hypothetical protein